jgi:hypothetical protein
MSEQPAGQLATVRAEYPDWLVRLVPGSVRVHRALRLSPDLGPGANEPEARISEVPATLLALLRGPG